MVFLACLLGGIGINAFWFEPTNLQVTSYIVMSDKVIGGFADCIGGLRANKYIR